MAATRDDKITSTEHANKRDSFYRISDDYLGFFYFYSSYTKAINPWYVDESVKTLKITHPLEEEELLFANVGMFIKYFYYNR